LLQARHAADLLFDGKGDLLLDLLRRERRRRAVDLDLDGRRIGKGVDIELSEREGPHDGAGNHAKDHPEAMPQRKVDNPIQHANVSLTVVLSVEEVWMTRDPSPHQSELVK